jgi:hypothetical protein
MMKRREFITLLGGALSMFSRRKRRQSQAAPLSFDSDKHGRE